jgi:acylphosphatase
MSRERRIVHYCGRVQGVGFRYTTRRIAANFPVEGLVQNLPDGRVELVVEGEAADLDRFLSAIRKRFDGFVRDESCDVRPTTGEFNTFRIRH